MTKAQFQIILKWMKKIDQTLRSHQLSGAHPKTTQQNIKTKRLIEEKSRKEIKELREGIRLLQMPLSNKEIALWKQKKSLKKSWNG